MKVKTYANPEGNGVEVTTTVDEVVENKTNINQSEGDVFFISQDNNWNKERQHVSLTPYELELILIHAVPLEILEKAIEMKGKIRHE